MIKVFLIMWTKGELIQISCAKNFSKWFWTCLKMSYFFVFEWFSIMIHDISNVKLVKMNTNRWEPLYAISPPKACFKSPKVQSIKNQGQSSINHDDLVGKGISHNVDKKVGYVSNLLLQIFPKKSFGHVLKCLPFLFSKTVLAPWSMKHSLCWIGQDE